MTLAVLVARHRGPLTADLRRYYDVRLLVAEADVRAGQLTLGELADYAANLPPDSACARAADPDWWLTWELKTMRQQELNTRVAVWQRTEDGQKGRNRPEPFFTTELEAAAQRAARRSSDPMLSEMGAPTAVPFEEARARLGF